MQWAFMASYLVIGLLKADIKKFSIHLKRFRLQKETSSNLHSLLAKLGKYIFGGPKTHKRYVFINQ